MIPPLYPFRAELYLRPFCKYDLNLLKESGLDEGELHKTSQTDSKFFYYVILAASDLPIGFVSFDDKELTISYRIAEKYQNLGWGTKAAYMLVLIIFATYGETILFADIYRDNQASRRVVEKIGFTFWELRQCGAMCLRYRLQV